MKKSLLFSALALAFSAQAVDLKISLDSDPITFDPMEKLETSVLQMAHTVFDPLLRYDQALTLQPRLAESWEQVDDTTLRFKLRQGVKFHSGNDFTAEDIIWSFKRVNHPNSDFKPLFTAFKEVVKVDDFTVEFKLNQPYPLAFESLTNFFIMDSKFYSGQTAEGKDKAEVDKTITTFANGNTSGTGPFKLESREQGIKVVYTRNADYWDKANQGNVDKIILTPIKENATRVSALLSGDIDWIYPVPPTELERVQKAKNIATYNLTSDRIITLQLNQGVVPEFKDVKVRQAVNLAINNAGIVEKIMRGNATTAGQLAPKGYVSYTESLQPQFDLKKAQELMKEAGHEKGFKVTMISTNDRYVNDEKIAQAVAGMLAKINIQAELTTMPRAQYWNEFDKCASGIQMIGWSSDTGDSANYSEFLTATRNADKGTGQFNCGGYSIAEIDNGLQEASVLTDKTKRQEVLQKIAKLEMDEALIIPLHWQNLDWAYSNKIENFPDIINLKNFPYFSELKVKEGK